jgi:protein SCO1
MKKITLFLCLWALLFAHGAFAHDLPEAAVTRSGDIGVEEKTGRYLPKDIHFYDEKGQEIKLGNLLGKPAILTLVYYTCDRICPLLLSGLAEAIPRLTKTNGKDYRIITVSFDETDTQQAMAAIRKNYIKAVDAGYPGNGWVLLTGDRENINKLTGSVGFRFRKDRTGFDHPVVLIFLSADGKITKYLYVTKYSYGVDNPVSFSSFDLNLALTEADEGKAVTGLKKAVLYCFSHEPPGQSKFLNFIAIVGLVTLFSMVSFFIYLQWSSKRYRKSRGYGNEG